MEGALSQATSLAPRYLHAGHTQIQIFARNREEVLNLWFPTTKPLFQHFLPEGQHWATTGMTLPALSAASFSAGLQVNCSPATPGDYFIATFLICILLAQTFFFSTLKLQYCIFIALPDQLEAQLLVPSHLGWALVEDASTPL